MCCTLCHVPPADLQKQLLGSKAQAAAAEQAAAAATSRLAAVESELEAAHACTAASELRVSGLLAEQHQLRDQLRQTQEEAERLAAAVQQAAADTAKGMASEQQAGAVEVADKAASSQTPPPSLDATCIRDLRDALRAQHEATLLVRRLLLLYCHNGNSQGAEGLALGLLVA